MQSHLVLAALLVSLIGISYSHDCRNYGAVQLEGGQIPSEGRVEICSKYGTWATVGKNSWDEMDASVVCQELGYQADGAVAYTDHEWDLEDDPGVLDYVHCDGTEKRLQDCNARTYDFHESNFVGIAGVRCIDKNKNFTSCQDGAVRLVGASSPYNGTVEVCINDKWGTVCHDEWDIADANVVCAQLGFLSWGSTPVHGSMFGAGSGNFFLDNVGCTGSEKSLLECSSSPIGQHDCDTTTDAAGVVCKEPVDCVNGSLRLVGGMNNREGRLEICIDRSWGTVCDDSWDDRDASVACRQLRHSSIGAKAYSNAHFGEGKERIYLDDVQCAGTEATLVSCPQSGIGMHNCMHNEDAGISCKAADDCEEGTMRLADGGSPYEGRVEICIYNMWGTVCDDNFSPFEAGVVCYGLGYLYKGARIVPDAAFGEGNASVYLDGLACTGKETSLMDCARTSIYNPGCAHSNDVGVMCRAQMPITVCNSGDVRLVNGPTEYNGTVEVCYNNAWGTVCDDSWDANDASVVCRQLDYLPSRATAYSRAHFGEGIGDIHLDNVRCTGSESQLILCDHNGVENHDCSHNEDAGVTCRAPDGCIHGQMRLANGGSPYEGRVEICIDNEWGTICDDDSFGAFEAGVVCYGLGYLYKGAKIVRGAAFGEGDGEDPIYLDDLDCTGKETSLLDCPHAALYNPHCSHSRDVGVVCRAQMPITVCSSGEVRLVNGGSEFNGTVEVCYNNAWGTVCDDGWSENDARVVCRQLGYISKRAVAYSSAHFGIGSGDIHLDDVNCEGTEPDLVSCAHSEVGTHDCSHSEDAGVHCYEPVDCDNGELKLVGSDTEGEGTVLICYDREFGTVCDDSWDDNDAAVVCRQLDHYTEGAKAYGNNYFGHGTGPILLDDVACTGNEERLIDCDASPICTHNCQHYEDAGVYCERKCIPGEIRLVGGGVKYEGKVEYCNEDQQWGDICGYSWAETEAAVACHQLGHSRTGAVPFDGTIFGPSDREINLIDVACRGNETSLDDCELDAGSGDMVLEIDCGLAGVRCMAEVLGDVCNDGDIRLADGTCEPEGRVEICIDNAWGTVCSDSWDDRDASVVCNQLGYIYARPKAYTNAHFGAGSGDILLDNVSCTGSESKLLSCRSNPVKTHNCQHSKDAGVSCRAPEPCYNGQVKLVPTSNTKKRNEGRVDVCYGEEWGTVCDDSWDDHDAMVVCRQLGYSPWRAEAFGRAHFGQGTCSIFLDDLMCTGRERSLLDCMHNGIGIHNCQHNEDAGARCREMECYHGEIKLVDGGVDYEGRVEYCDNGAWGSVCDRTWTASDAAVVCMMLYYPTEGVVPFGNAWFGSGDDLIVLADVECRGTEYSLSSCPIGAASGCSHSHDVGVRCIPNYINTVCDEGEVRLVDANGKTNKSEGRVEICIENAWGTVCDDNWDNKDASVVCSQLKFSRFGAVARHSAYFTAGVGGIFLDEVACTGYESGLLSCPSLPIYSHNCQHSEDAGVSCIVRTCNHGDIRLVGGAVGYEGRVEYCYDGVWGTICDDGWSTEDASVVCAMLGHPREGAVAFSAAAFGQGTGHIVLSDLGCSGTEESLDYCSRSDPSNCRHSEDAGVRCMANVIGTLCNDGEVRIVDADGKTCGPNGTVEICINGTWGTVCDNSWDQNDASVVCGQLGFSTEGAVARLNAYYSPGKGPIFLDNVQCSGTEGSLLSCLSSPIGSSNCAHSDAAGVSCRKTVDMSKPCEHGDIVLIGGPDKSKGTVQICINNVWGTVCDDSWDNTDAKVVCSQLGYSGRRARAHSGAHFVPGAGSIYFDDVECTGAEHDLLVCPKSDFKVHDCQHSEDAGVSCYEDCEEGDLRLRGGDNCTEGRVEVCYRNRWGTVCDDEWDNNDAKVVCSELGLPSDGAQAVGNAGFGQGKGLTLMDDVNCRGNESRLKDCSFPGWNIHNCQHSEDAGVRCPVPDDYCTHGDLRLVGGTVEGEGRVEICINNLWSTVCDDSWGTKEATVVCNQLNFQPFGAQAVKRAGFGEGTCSIVLDEVSCDGTEDSLLDCVHDDDIGCHDCLHSEDAGVICEVEEPCSLILDNISMMGDTLSVDYSTEGPVGEIQCVLDPVEGEPYEYINCVDNPIVITLDPGTYVLRIIATGCVPEVYEDVDFTSA